MTETTRHEPLPSLAQADWLTAPATQAVFAALRNAGHDARAVGGVVRNALLGLPVTDIDIATPARPEAVTAAARSAGLKAVPTGIEHGTVTVVSGGHGYEVTTLRRDVETDGRRAVVAFTDDWAEDARRRDFTMNALYCSADGTVHDPLGGYADLAARRVRFIGDADARIREDYLRILRFFRVHAVYGEGPLDRAGLLACERHAAGLERLSAERIQAELLKLMAARGVMSAITAMVEHGLLTRVLGLAPRPGVLAGMMAAERSLGLGADAVLRLSALALAVAEDGVRLAGRLKLSGADAARLTVVAGAIRAQMLSLDERGARRALYVRGIAGWRRDVMAALAADDGAAKDAARLGDLYALPDRWVVPKLPVKGADLLALGVPAGVEVGRILAAVEGWWLERDFPSEAAVRMQLAEAVARWKGR